MKGMLFAAITAAGCMASSIVVNKKPAPDDPKRVF
jgi:hydroxyethylthiazole kinase-like sugar kinase family protein